MTIYTKWKGFENINFGIRLQNPKSYTSGYMIYQSVHQYKCVYISWLYNVDVMAVF